MVNEGSMKKLILSCFLILCACTASPDLVATQTATLPPTSTATPSQTPTLTFTPTLTLTPTVTPTFTPTPTPVGGGVVKIAFIGRDQQGEYAMYIGNPHTSTYTAVTPIEYAPNPYIDQQEIPDRTGAISLAWSPDGRYLAFNTGSVAQDSLSVLDVETGLIQKIHELPKGSWVDKIDWAPGDQRVFAYKVSSFSGTFRSDFWIGNLDKSEPVNFARNAFGMRGWSPDGSAYYFSSSPLRRYEPYTGKTTTINEPRVTGFNGGYSLQYLPDIDDFLVGAFSVEENGDLTSSLFFLNNPTPLAINGMDFGPETLSFSPDRKRLYLRAYSLACILIIDNQAVTCLEDTFTGFFGWTPDSSGLVVMTRTDEAEEILSGVFDETKNPNESDKYAAYDEQVPRILQLAVADAATGEILTTIPFPKDIQPMIKIANQQNDNGWGLGLHWQTQP